MRLQFILRALLVAVVAFCSLMATDVAEQLALLGICFGIATTAVLSVINQ
jgi:hypothetical protein